MGFYSTYEELKRGSMSEYPYIKKSFYSTYEELKLNKYILEDPLPERFLQYLWGIETIVLEHCKEHIGEFLQYLWGIETFL